MNRLLRLPPVLLACMMLLGSAQPASAGDYSSDEPIATVKAKAKAGDPKAQFDLADRYMTGGRGVRQNVAKGLEMYRKSAAQGYAEAQNMLGVFYLEGEDVRKDYARALQFFRKAADQGHCAAQEWIGEMYNEGKGVPQDKSAAKAWYSMACRESKYACEKRDRLEKEGY